MRSPAWSSNSFTLVPALCGMALTIFVLAAAAPAATLDDYARRVDSARLDVNSLRGLDSVAGVPTTTKREKADHIRSLMPASESVEWNGSSVETNNAWLLDALTAFQEEPSLEKRTSLMMGVDDRLLAISSKIAELTKAVEAERSKDEDKRKLAEILKRAEYQPEEKKDPSVFERWRQAIMAWLRKMFPRVDLSPQQSSGMASLSTILQVLLYLVLTAGIGFLLFRLFNFISGRSRGRGKSSPGDRLILGERIGADESAADLFAEAEQLARDGKLRLAIRKGYIALLCDLGDRGALNLARHKTNRDYLRDLRGRKELFENMTGLTGNFEEHWYGHTETDEAAWQNFRESYFRTVRMI